MTDPVSHPDESLAYHFEWEFRQEALIRDGAVPIGVNFHPHATDFRSWIDNEGQLSILVRGREEKQSSLSNPYAYYASVLGLILGRSINSVHDYCESVDEIDPLEAELDRIRLYNEQLLYTARFCEAIIKQLLYCTAIPGRHYEGLSLHGLLSSDCKSCRKKKRPHRVSLLGSLAHRYGLCLEFERCLFEHLALVNKRRNSTAAHAEATLLNVGSAGESREKLKEDHLSLTKNFRHMLKHVADLENLMFTELHNSARKQMLSVFIKPRRKPPAESGSV